MIRRRRLEQQFDVDPAAVPGQGMHSGAAPRWVDVLCIAQVAYVVTVAASMLMGFGGPTITHYVALVSDEPAALAALIITAATARYSPRGPLRTAWILLTVALGLYFIGTAIGVSSWLQGQDPFPGVADLFYCAFYPALAAASLALLRAYALRVAWAQLTLDATIFVVGFAAFFWFLVLRPAAMSVQVDLLKQALSLAYLSCDCVLVLMLGVLLITGAGLAGGRRVPSLLLAGFATTFLADIFWSLAKVRGYYLPGGFYDVLYMMCYVPLAAAGREQMRVMRAPIRASSPRSDAIARSLPYAAMLAAFLVLVYLARGDIGGPATAMAMIVFTLTLLLMVRQSVAWRGAALVRERQAARLVEDRYASLIANAADVIMIVAADGTLRFASPAAERTLGLSPEAIMGHSLAEIGRASCRERV